MIGAKILITGLPNTGKTSLLKTLNPEKTLVISRDGKPFSLPLVHTNVEDYGSITELLDIVEQKIEAFKEHFKEYPETIVFDSVSRIFTDIEAHCSTKYKGYDVWSQVNKEINLFTNTITSLQTGGFNVVLIAHAVWDTDAKKYIETCKGSFAKTGGFLSTVDYAVNIDIVGNKRIVTTRGNNLSRTLLSDIPEKLEANDFNLQEYINAIVANASAVTKWSI